MKLPLQEVQILWEQLDAESYIREIPSLSQTNRLTFSNQVTFFVGENGSGKSSLLEAIALAYGFNPEGGSVNYQFSTYDSHSDLSQVLRLAKGIGDRQASYFLRAESFYNVASQEEAYFGSRSQGYHKQSHGESFLSLVQQRFRGGGLYLLDEPEAALSPQRQLTLLSEMHRLAQAGAQFIIASHSPLLTAYPGATIFQFTEQGIHRCDYEDTEAYQVTKLFLDNPKQILHHLLKEEENDADHF